MKLELELIQFACWKFWCEVTSTPAYLLGRKPRNMVHPVNISECVCVYVSVCMCLCVCVCTTTQTLENCFFPDQKSFFLNFSLVQLFGKMKKKIMSKNAVVAKDKTSAPI